jgi:pheromone shutdown-related protein TraB
VRAEGREYLVVGTAHVSRESVERVREVIERERPDVVCLELDERRYAVLVNPARFESLDLRQVMREKQLATLMLNLVLAAYQRRLGFELGVQPGADLLEAVRAAEQLRIPIALCDRDVRVTLRRIWAALSIWRRFLLLSTLLAGAFQRPEIREEDLRELRREDVLSSLMRELGRAFPGLRSVLIDERDRYLAHRVQETEGRRAVVVVGAGHAAGVARALAAGARADLQELDRTPPPSRLLRTVGWGVPVLILGALAAIAVRQGAEAAGQNLLFWVLANGIPCGLGAALALAHPGTVLAAFLAAPVTSLTPVIGAGYVTAFVQAWLRPPRVAELRRVGEDSIAPRRWWRNRLLRIFLVFLLTTLGSLLGTFVGGAEILRNLFRA